MSSLSLDHYEIRKKIRIYELRNKGDTPRGAGSGFAGNIRIYKWGEDGGNSECGSLCPQLDPGWIGGWGGFGCRGLLGWKVRVWASEGQTLSSKPYTLTSIHTLAYLTGHFPSRPPARRVTDPGSTPGSLRGRARPRGREDRKATPRCYYGCKAKQKTASISTGSIGVTPLRCHYTFGTSQSRGKRYKVHSLTEPVLGRQ